MMNNNMMNGMDPMQLFNMVSNSQNPVGMMKQMFGDNPFLQQAMRMTEGKSPDAMKEVIFNVAKQKGIPMEQVSNIAKMFGMNF